MDRISNVEILQYVNENIADFHDKKIRIVSGLDLSTILKRKNPYLYRAKDIVSAGDFIKSVLDAFLSSSEEEKFGGFLERLAIFIAEKTFNGRKSSAHGIDLEFSNDNVRYLVSIKSGPNWGNSSQYAALERNFKNAVSILKQSGHTINVQPVLGICYGKSKTTFPRNFMKIMGQNFWYLIQWKPRAI